MVHGKVVGGCLFIMTQPREKNVCEQTFARVAVAFISRTILFSDLTTNFCDTSHPTIHPLSLPPTCQTWDACNLSPTCTLPILLITMINLKKMQIFAILGHFWPVFGLLWPWYECWRVQMSIFLLILSRMSKTGKKNLNNNDQFEENADVGHFWPFLACFWPVLAPV